MATLAWHLFREQLDPGDRLHDQLDRLAALRVELTVLSPEETAALFERFVELFIEPVRALDIRAARAEGGVRLFTTDIAHCLRFDRTDRGCITGVARWLAAGAEDARAVRFDRRASLPAVELRLPTMQDAWAGSWPGVFVNYQAGRAAVITHDYADWRCDLGPARGTPYR